MAEERTVFDSLFSSNLNEARLLLIRVDNETRFDFSDEFIDAIEFSKCSILDQIFQLFVHTFLLHCTDTIQRMNLS